MQQRPGGEVVARIWIAMPQIRSDRRKVSSLDMMCAAAYESAISVSRMCSRVIAALCTSIEQHNMSVRTELKLAQSSYQDVRQQPNSSRVKGVCAPG